MKQGQNRKKIWMVFGTRPEAIKMAPVISAFESYKDKFELKVCITAQHRQMLDQVLNLFSIVPDYDLNIMKGQQDLTDITTAVLSGLRDLFKQEKPDLIMVHGDTTTTMAASLAAFYHKIPVAHVEAGLRTHQFYSPWPEEKNRHITAALTSLHFAPTQKARENLLAEGIVDKTIVVTGNTVVDALLLTLKRFEQNPAWKNEIAKPFPCVKKGIKRILVTAHRRENFGEGMEQIFQSLIKLAERPDIEIIFPVHLNPNVSEPAKRLLGGKPNIYLIDPVDYAPFVYLMSTSYLILTDSGGVQEEAPTLGVPVLVMRETSERMEAIERGVVKLVGPHADRIINEATTLLENDEAYKRMSKAQNPYGDGTASNKILNNIFLTLFPTT